MILWFSRLDEFGSNYIKWWLDMPFYGWWSKVTMGWVSWSLGVPKKEFAFHSQLKKFTFISSERKASSERRQSFLLCGKDGVEFWRMGRIWIFRDGVPTPGRMHCTSKARKRWLGIEGGGSQFEWNMGWKNGIRGRKLEKNENIKIYLVSTFYQVSIIPFEDTMVFNP